MKSNLYKLLRRNISASQTLGYLTALLVGLAIVAVGIRFWSDAAASSGEVGSYIVVQKKVTGAGGLFGGEPPSFTPAEVAQIEQQPWAKRVGAFSTATFDVYARVSGMGRSMSTALFLEAVPDEFMDVHPAGWDFDPASLQRGGAVPVVIPREYLSLYNYGFAPARGLPQVSEEMVGLIPIEMSVSGQGRQLTLPARIVGFSNRINTIAVPRQFIDWAVAHFGSGPASCEAPSRLIIETARPADTAALDWITQAGYETTADNAQARIGSIAGTASTIVLAIGAVIIALALFIVTLSIHLLLYKNRPILFELMQLGYTPGQVGALYMATVAALNCAMALIAIVAAQLLRPLWMEPFEAAGLSGGSPAATVGATIGLALLLTAVNCFTICRMTRRAFRK